MMQSLLLTMLATLAQDETKLVATIPEEIREASDFAFSRDGKIVAYCAFKKLDDALIIRGDWRSKPYQVCKAPLLSGDGKSVTFFAFAERKNLACLNDSVLFEYTERQGFYGAKISADGKVVALLVGDFEGKKVTVAVNGKIQKPHSGMGSHLALSDDGSTAAFSLESEKGACVVVNDQEGPFYEEVTNAALSADGKIVAYGAETATEFLLIHGDRKLSVKKKPDGVFMADDGKVVGYWTVKSSMKRVILGDREGPEFKRIIRPVLSPDGKHVAYRALNEDRKYVVIDDATTEVPGIESDPVFLDGGKKVGYGVRKDRELWWNVVEVK